MEYLSRKSIETIAAHITGNYKNLPQFTGQQVEHIDAETMAHDLFGLHIEYFHLSKDRSALGVTAFGKVGIKVYDSKDRQRIYQMDGRTILIETDLKDDPNLFGRYNFTVMHEIAHQVLARRYLNSSTEVKNRIVYYRGKPQQYPIRDWSEWQADNLASALLLPTEIVHNALQKFDFGDGIRILNKVYRPQEYTRFCEMAKSLGASKQALALRLKRLGLLKQDFLKDPYALADIFPDENELY